MSPENKGKRVYKTFQKERSEPKPIIEGSFERVIVFVKPELCIQPNETMGVGDSDWWFEIEDKAAALSPKEAIMQFYLHDTGHRTLAESVVGSFLTTRTTTKASGWDEKQRELTVERVAHKLYKNYPRKYRRQIRE